MMRMKTRKFLTDSMVTIIAIVIGFIIIFPILFGILGAFKSSAEFSSYPPTLFPKSFTYLENFKEAVAKMPIMRYMYNSLVVALLGTTVRLAFAILAAFVFVFYDFKGKNFFFFIILGTMMLPADTLIVTNYLTASRLGLIDTHLGMAITSFVGATQMFMLRQNFKTQPKEFREAAAMDGCGDLRFLTSILLPIARPVVMTLFVQSFVTLWNAYLWPLLVTNKNSMRTVQVGITYLTTIEDTNYYLVLAGVTLILIPSFILFVILRRNIVKGMTAGALVG
jgi:sn-glycerol 3-phosphate transport system permease protein